MSEQNQKSRSGPLAVTTAAYGDGIVVISLAGELDRATVSHAEAAIERGLRVGGTLVVDLEELEFMDSSGVALLARLSNGDGRLRVISSRSLGVTRILAVTGLDELLGDALVRSPEMAVG
jgi:anti-anti-sigma factor